MSKSNATGKLKKSNNFLDCENIFNLSLYDKFPDPVVIFSCTHSIRYVNAAFEKFLKFKSSEVVGKTPTFNFLGIVRTSNKLATYDMSRAVRFQCQVKGKDGHALWIEVMSSPLTKEERVWGALTIWHDIGELKKGQIFNSAYEDSPIPVLIESFDRKIIYVNHALEEMTGYSSQELIGTSPPFPWWPEEKKVEYNQVNESRRLERVDSSERLHRKKDGTLMWVSFSTRLVKEKGCIKYVVVNWIDITARKKIEEDLRMSEVFNSTLLKNAPNPILVSGSDSAIVYANPALEKLTGYTLDEIKGSKLPYPWWPKVQIPVYGKRYQRPENFRAERQVVSKSGEQIWIDMNFATIQDRGGVLYRISNWVDITERKKMEDSLNALYQKEKLQREELEEEARQRAMFINVLAHELRTPITPILASSGSLVSLYQNKKDNLPGRLAQNIHNSADVLARRLEELLDMARYARGVFQLNLQPVALKLFFEQAVERFKPMLRADQQLITIIDKTLPMADIDASRIEQVLINLLSNAVKFSPEGGTITLTANIRDQNLLVEVQDEGIGISAEDQKKLFQPYYRVERDQNRFQGLGLGLAVSKQIVEAHNGKIWVTSQKGQGSIFCFEIPVKGNG